jgi:hypothetical protein
MSACVAAVTVPVLATPTWASTTKTFSYTGAEQTFTVPSAVYSLHVLAVGGVGGAEGSTAGGFGAKATADVAVHPGEKLYVEVGGDGSAGTRELGNAAGGFNGGGSGGQLGAGGSSILTGGGGGGGASDVQTAPRSAGSTLGWVVAAGGGGGGASAGVGGNAGSPGTPDPSSAPDGCGPSSTDMNGCGGGAGTASAGGVGGAGGSAGSGTTGSVAQGGNGEDEPPFGPELPGGGGGGGWFGGGGGGDGAELPGGGSGGGGSSHFGAGTSHSSLATDTTGTPEITFTYGPLPRPNTSITKTTLHHIGTTRSATFAFTANQKAVTFRCAFARAGRALRYAKCASPKTYRKLAKAKYVFAVRAVGRSGTDPTPAKKTIKFTH